MNLHPGLSTKTREYSFPLSLSLSLQKRLSQRQTLTYLNKEHAVLTLGMPDELISQLTLASSLALHSASSSVIKGARGGSAAAGANNRKRWKLATRANYPARTRASLFFYVHEKEKEGEGEKKKKRSFRLQRLRRSFPSQSLCPPCVSRPCSISDVCGCAGLSRLATGSVPSLRSDTRSLSAAAGTEETRRVHADPRSVVVRGQSARMPWT